MFQTAKKIFDEVASHVRSAHLNVALGALMFGGNPAAVQFLDMQKKMARRVGVGFYPHIEPEDLCLKNAALLLDAMCDAYDGVIVQLPLPQHLDASFLDGIPTKKDPDVLSSESYRLFEQGTLHILPPVTGAVQEILLDQGISIEGKNVVIVGAGGRVGKPTAIWAKRKGANVTVLSKQMFGDGIGALQQADIIISGAGVPWLVTSEMIKEGVVIIDAGTSQKNGSLCGDIAPICRGKAAFLTPVPGGVGPVTTAVLFRNLLDLKD
ncbi:MAG: bifunctional 5,10-methylenetetrahydrofolate dehydrogenase/5,10-methenyltetrahydrofolate cyclohydrolase [Patescibacteria group bacterium]